MRYRGVPKFSHAWDMRYKGVPKFSQAWDMRYKGAGPPPHPPGSAPAFLKFQNEAYPEKRRYKLSLYCRSLKFIIFFMIKGAVMIVW
jgi:hypothetical protein